MKIKVSYVSTLPLEGNSPSVIIIEDDLKEYYVEFIDNTTNEVITKSRFKSNQYVYGNRQWFTNWLIKVYDDKNVLIHTDIFNLKDKTAFIKIDGLALGDNLAWVPYVEEFRKKHNCNVICSTFFNELFVDVYSNILFVKPNTQIENVYAQYYIGANSTDNKKYSPSNSTKVPLQKVSSDILGLEFNEVVPNLIHKYFQVKRKYNEKYVCISEHGSHPTKEWKSGKIGWQNVVDYLNTKGYKVLVISKEPTTLDNVINLTGNIPLKERMNDLYFAEFFIGVSSGLSWLSWAVGTPVVMISDCTPNWHEFKTKMTRIGGENLDSVNYDVIDNTSHTTVINVINGLIDK